VDKSIILDRVNRLIRMHREGRLGGEVMPEDANPKLDRDSRENYLYFTLPMALNYQRNSYSLWQSALQTYEDMETQFVFFPELCVGRSFEEIQQSLTKYRLALQRQKQTEIWIKLCETFLSDFGGDVRRLFDENDNDIERIKRYVQLDSKKSFPYLSGTKICNYWLYVIHQYTDRKFISLDALTVAPDTHVCKASLELGVITEEEYISGNVREITAEAWRSLLENTGLKPIDVHTPLWLWSRNGFCEKYD